MKHSITNSDNHNQKTSRFLLAILGTLMAFTSLSTDIYLAAMPQMQHEMKSNIELTITGFLIGFSIAQIAWGPISDRFGRRLPLAWGILLFIIGSASCALSLNISQIVFWRVIQAFGACTGPMLSRAMVRDIFSRNPGSRNAIDINDYNGYRSHRRAAAGRTITENNFLA